MAGQMTNLDKEATKMYMKLFQQYSVNYEVKLAPTGVPMVVVEDSCFPNVARSDDLRIHVDDLILRTHGYIMVTLENLTARNVRKQTRGYRTSFNLSYCPVQQLGDKDKRFLTDLLIAYTKKSKHFILISSSGMATIVDHQRGNITQDRVKQIMNDGLAPILTVDETMESWELLSSELSSARVEDVIMASYPYAEYCPKCSKHIKVIDSPATFMNAIDDILDSLFGATGAKDKRKAGKDYQ